MSKKIYSLIRFFSFFLTISFTVTCSMFLFLHFLEFDEEQIRAAAPITFGNIMLLTFLFCLIDSIRIRYTVDRPVRLIREGIDRVMAGDLSSRIPDIKGISAFHEYDRIVLELNRLFEELNSVETLRTDFISSVSHELKTPMAVIQNYGTLLQTPGLSEEKRLEYSKKVTEQTRKLSGMVTNILRLNKLENQQIFPDMRRLDLSEHICESILEFETVWEEKGISIETDLADHVEIMGDSEMLTLVWNNLMSNAIKFTKDRIMIRTEIKNGRAVACVIDNGCGMSKETGKRIFQKFYQGDTSHAAQGNGLGLALVKRIVDIHKGDIHVSSRLGEGSTFQVQFDLKK